jgi:hypothetical protein
MRPAKPKYTFTVEALPGSVPPEVRVRRFLKAAFRSYGLRVVAMNEVDPSPTSKAPDASCAILDAAKGDR